MMPNETPLPDRLAAAWPPQLWQGTTVLVAVSAGADSVALLRALVALRPVGAAGRLVVGHFNHGLRGPESDADEQFVAALAGELGLECRAGRGDVALAAELTGDGIEAAAREARYAFLQDE